jgi:hypothetical protein
MMSRHFYVLAPEAYFSMSFSAPFDEIGGPSMIRIVKPLWDKELLT